MTIIITDISVINDLYDGRQIFVLFENFCLMRPFMKLLVDLNGIDELLVLLSSFEIFMRQTSTIFRFRELTRKNAIFSVRRSDILLPDLDTNV